MEPYLILLRGEKTFLLTRSDSRLHIITVDRRMTEEVKNWLLYAPRTVEEMNQRQLRRFSMELSKLRGVCVGGLEAGNVVQFYLPEGKKRYQLAEDTGQATVDTLFSGLDWFKAPKFQTTEDWRLKHQDRTLRDKIFLVGDFVNFGGLVYSLLLLLIGFQVRWLGILMLLWVGVALALYALFPAYYSIFENPRNTKKQSAQSLNYILLMGPMALEYGAFQAGKIFGWWRALLIGIPIVIALAVLYWKRCPDFYDMKRLVCFLLVGALLCGGPVLGTNILLDYGPAESIHTEILELEKVNGGRAADRYYIHVLLDGEEVSIPITRQQFQQLETGERVEIELHDGFLGIPYAAYSP